MAEILSTDREYLAAPTQSAAEVYANNPNAANLLQRLYLPAYVGITASYRSIMGQDGFSASIETDFDEFQRPIHEDLTIVTERSRSTTTYDWQYSQGALDYSLRRGNGRGKEEKTLHYHWVDVNRHDFNGKGEKVKIDGVATEDGGLVVVSKVNREGSGYVETATYSRQGLLVVRKVDGRGDANRNKHSASIYTYDDTGRLVRVERNPGFFTYLLDDGELAETPPCVTTVEYTPDGVQIEGSAAGLVFLREQIQLDSKGRPIVIDRTSGIIDGNGETVKHIEIEYNDNPANLIGMGSPAVSASV